MKLFFKNLVLIFYILLQLTTISICGLLLYILYLYFVMAVGLEFPLSLFNLLNHFSWNIIFKSLYQVFCFIIMLNITISTIVYIVIMPIAIYSTYKLILRKQLTIVQKTISIIIPIMALLGIVLFILFLIVLAFIDSHF